METVGQILSIGRNSKKLSISNIAIELKISKSIIIDLENDNIKNDSDIIFNIGHLRSYSNFLELDTDTIIKKFKDEVSFNIKEEKKHITPIVENNFFKIEKFFAASIILIIFTSFYFLFIDQNDNEINFALVPDIPESLEPIVEKANTFDNLSQSSDVDKTDLINNSSALASIEYDEDLTTVATLKMLNPTWIQLRDKANNIVLSKLMDKNEEFSYELKLNSILLQEMLVIF